jgi:hypothetical protein
MRKIGVFFAPHVHRSQLVARSMVGGMNRLGENAQLKVSVSHRGRCEFDVAIFYGLASNLQQLFADYRENKRAIYVDLGYWGRRKLSRWDGYHKLALNSRHPTAYFQNRPKGPERFAEFNIPIAPWRKSGRHILVVGMSAKASWAEGLQPEQWERETIAKLRTLTDRPIVYRPKPNWMDARPIEGSTFQRTARLHEAFADCHAVVAHHSNTAVDALVAGIPCICPDGAASVLSGHSLEHVEDPPMPDGREQWAWDLAWTQWSIEEMQSGAAYRYLDSEGLLGS